MKCCVAIGQRSVLFYLQYFVVGCYQLFRIFCHFALQKKNEILYPLCHRPCFSYKKLGWFCVRLVYKFLVPSFSYEFLLQETWTVCHQLYLSYEMYLFLLRQVLAYQSSLNSINQKSERWFPINDRKHVGDRLHVTLSATSFLFCSQKVKCSFCNNNNNNNNSSSSFVVLCVANVVVQCP